jgi:hypothetical protein
MAKRKPKGKPSTLFAVPAIVGLKVDISRALRAGKSQIAEANAFAQSVGCGAPFRPDGIFEADRNTKNRFIRESNKRRVDQGEPRVVNFDGGYGDET